MSRTLMSIITASILALASVGMMIGRYQILGEEVRVPAGPGTWKVTMLVQGQGTGAGAKLLTTTPLDFGHQHILDELYRSDELLAKPPDSKHPERRQVLWTQRPGVPNGSFRIRYEFYCSVNVRTPTAPMSELAKAINAAPHPSTQLKSEPRIQSDDPDISTLARSLTDGLEDVRDQFEALYRYVEQEIRTEPNLPGSGLTALECLRNGSGGSGGKSRLLVALCRNRGIPARLVTGLALRRGREQNALFWVEAWVHNHWMPACPSFHNLGRVPASYLVFNYGDYPLVRGRNVRDLKYAFLIERPAAEEAAATNDSPLRRLLTRLSLYALPPPEQRLVEFLLLLPIAALIVCIYRNVIGLGSFGTFAPALVGLAFRDLGSLPGFLVFVSLVLIGWVLRRILDRFHLLQVPRLAFLLSLIVLVLISAIVAANYHDLAATKYVSLFPMVILTGMIERFWTLEVEDSTISSFRTLLTTMLIAASISLFLSLHAVVRHMFRFPETLGLIMAAQLLIGRYTGYRFSELFRFRDFLKPECPESPGMRAVGGGEWRI